MKFLYTILFICFFTFAPLAQASAPSTQVVSIQFLPSTSIGVTTYIMFVSPVAGSPTAGFSITYPWSSARNVGNGVYAYDVSLTADVPHYITMRAMVGQTQSVNSNELTEQDTDMDGYLDGHDNCATIANGDQSDVDNDGVGDVCDNCTDVYNPHVTPNQITYLTANPWATLTGTQRDDDHDGYGNECDGDFTQDGRTTSADTIQYKTSIGQSITDDTCGRSGTRPCAIFNVNTTGSLISIGVADTAVYKTLIGKAPGPTCTNCPLPCIAGTAGVCP